MTGWCLFSSRMWPRIAAGLMLAALTGCGSRPGLTGARTPVAGTVTLDGEPVPFALVEFSRDEGKGEIESAVVQNGRFELKAGGGLPEGHYSVAILPYVPEVEETASMTPEQRKAITASQGLVPEGYHRRGALSAEVKAPSSSGLTFAMKKGGP